jgi:hypothetical protein
LVYRALEGREYLKIAIPADYGSGQNLLAMLWAETTGSSPGEISRTRKAGGEYVFGAPLAGTKATVESEHGHVASEIVNTHSLAREMSRRGCPVVVDDLEHLDASAYHVLADLYKKASDHRQKLICIAAMSNGDVVLGSSESARSRVMQVSVPMFTPREMWEVSTNGFRQLGLGIHRDGLKRIHYHSCGIPRVLHGLCREAAKSALEGAQSSVDFHIQAAIDTVRGDGTLNRAMSKLESLIGNRFGPSDQPVIQVIATTIALLTSDSFEKREVVSILDKMDPGSVSNGLEGLTAAGIIERVSRLGANTREFYRFPELETRLALRFRVGEVEIAKRYRNSARFKQDYDQLEGNY